MKIIYAVILIILICIILFLYLENKKIIAFENCLGNCTTSVEGVGCLEKCRREYQVDWGTYIFWKDWKSRLHQFLQKPKISPESYHFSLESYPFSFKITDCDSIEIIRRRDWCYSELVKINPDINICNKISDNSSSKVYKIICQAIVEKNPAICNTLSGADLSFFCLPSVAEGLKNVSICNTIQNYDSNKKCLAILNVDLGECDKMKDILNKIYCYEAVAESTGDERVCNLIKVPFGTQIEVEDSASAAKNFCFMNVALKRKNPSICDNMEIKYDMKIIHDIAQANKDECLKESK